MLNFYSDFWIPLQVPLLNMVMLFLELLLLGLIVLYLWSSSQSDHIPDWHNIRHLWLGWWSEFWNITWLYRRILFMPLLMFCPSNLSLIISVFLISPQANSLVLISETWCICFPLSHMIRIYSKNVGVKLGIVFQYINRSSLVFKLLFDFFFSVFHPWLQLMTHDYWEFGSWIWRIPILIFVEILGISKRISARSF